MADTLKDSFTSFNHSYSTMHPAPEWAATPFVAGSSYPISACEVYVYKTGNLGGMTLSIRADSGGLPTGADLCVASVAEGDVPLTNPAWVKFTFTSMAALTNGTKYHIVIRAVSGSNYYLFGGNNGGLANKNKSSDAGLNWAYCYDRGGDFKTYYDPDRVLTVTTQAVSDIDKTTATGNGDVTDDGGLAVTERGVCYCLSSHGTPDTSDDKDTAAGTTGAFTTSMTGLTPATDYHARAYAINDAGTSYGELVDFTTLISATYVEILTKDLVDDTAGGTNTSTYPVSTNVHYDHCQAADPHTGYLKESDLTIDLGTELAPAMTQANWTEGAGWTITDLTGIATRVASAVTTLVPTSAIVPDVAKKYKVEFTISSWTAGTITCTFGGVVSSPLSGDQAVMEYVDPFTTGNLIFTPDATFAGVISDVSVKEYTGGEITVEGDILHYDSRGHANRLSHMTRHLNEMQTDTLLDKSRSSLSCTGGVLTYTLYAVYGNGTWNFNGVVLPGSVASVSVALTGGTDAVPKANHVYFHLVGNTPTLAVSLDADPTGVFIRVATFIVGAVSGSSYTIYSYHRNRREVDTLVNRTINRAIIAGTLYDSGALPTVLIGSISVASGGKWLQGIFPLEAANTVTSAAFYYMKKVAGVYNWFAGTALTDLEFYDDGVAVGNHEFANIVWGIVPTTTTAGGTLPTTVKLIAVLQTDPTVNYSSLATARQDLYDATNYFPPDTELKKVFLPIARTIVSEDNHNEFQTFDTGLYYKDLRGRITSGGGAATGTDLSGYVPRSLYDAYSILMATTDDTPVALTVNVQEVVGRLTGGTIDGIALGIADDNVVQIDDATVADNDYAKFTANGLEGQTYAQTATDLKDQFPQAITDNHVLTVDDASVSDDNFARFTANGIEGLTVAESVTALFGAALPENVTIQLDASLSADEKYSGISELGTLGATIQAGELLYLASTGKWLKCKADSATTSTNKLGIALADGVDTGTVQILLIGKMYIQTPDISCDYMHITNCSVTPATTWYVGTHSTDNGGNSGWIFTAP